MKSISILILLFAATSCSRGLHLQDYLNTSPIQDRESSAVAGARFWINEQFNSRLASKSDDEITNYLQKASDIASKLATGQSYGGEDDTGVSSFKDINELWVLLDRLAELASLEENKVCLSYNVRDYIKVVQSTFDSFERFSLLVTTNSEPSSNKRLFNYLKRLGIERSRKCLPQILNDFDYIVSHIDHKVLEDFDGMINKKALRNDEQLTLDAREIDFLEGKFDANKMMRAIKYSDTIELEPYSRSMLISFIDRACRIIRPPLIPFLDAYNFARLINPAEVGNLRVPQVFHKLNEYSRLCLQVQIEPLRSKAVKNINDNIGKFWFVKSG